MNAIITHPKAVLQWHVGREVCRMCLPDKESYKIESYSQSSSDILPIITSLMRKYTTPKDVKGISPSVECEWSKENIRVCIKINASDFWRNCKA